MTPRSVARLMGTLFLVACSPPSPPPEQAKDGSITDDRADDSASDAIDSSASDATLDASVADSVGEDRSAPPDSAIDARASDASMSDARASDASAFDARTSDASTSDARTSDARTSDASTSDASASDASATSDASDGGAGREVSIVGGRLLRGGVPFRPKGLSMMGLAVTPHDASAFDPGTVWARAHMNLRDPTALDQQLARFRSWGVDTVRYQVSQDGLDFGHVAADPMYQPLVIRTVRATLDAGFTVILSMRGNRPVRSAIDPCSPERLPCATTQRAWERLLADPANLGADRRLILELYDAPLPGSPNTAASWDPWRASHQPLVDRVRALGAQNVLIVDGVRAAKYAPINSSYVLRDPANELAYGVQPYPLYLGATGLSYYTHADLDEAFGRFCTTAPNVCVATEWSTSSENSCYQQDSASTPGLSSPLLAPSILRFLESRGIGTVLWPADSPGALVSDDRGTLTSFGPPASFACSTGAPTYLGMGTIMRDYYTTGALP